MTRILIAIDASEESLAAARQARQLFGPDAEYLAVTVTEDPPAWAAAPATWGGVYPYPFAAPYPLIEEELTGTSEVDAAEEARRTAHELAEQAGIGGAEVVGQVGEPTDAILAAADAHDVDAIVIGASTKGWWDRLIEGSVSSTLTKRSTRPVLIAGQSAGDD